MFHFTKYSKKIKFTIIKATAVSCIALMFAIPFVSKNISTNKNGYYTVVVNGKELGAVSSIEEAKEAYNNARRKISLESDAKVYMDVDFNIYQESILLGSRASEKEMEDCIYNSIAGSIIDTNSNKAYTIRINDFTLTLASKEDVIKVIEGTKQSYDENNEFQVKLSSGGTEEYAVTLVKSAVDSNDTNIVAATYGDNGQYEVEESQGSQDGLAQIGFNKNIVVTESAVSDGNIVSVEEAIEAITKQKQEKTVYTVVAGDCLSIVANKNNLSMAELLALNGITEDSMIRPGDQLVVTVPTPELSVIVTQRVTYEEDYNVDIIYVDNDSMYRGTSRVIDGGTTGHRVVTADVSYVDGIESSRTIVSQQIQSESQPQVIEVGTITPPTYIKPIYGGVFTSGFEYRWGSFHSGIDWSTPIGTPVMAAASGTVVRAGYYSDYGYCVDISHGNGYMTRYAHCSSLNVSVGQTVNQYQVIAYSGNTGYSTGPHVHFEVRINGTAVNPLNYVNKY